MRSGHAHARACFSSSTTKRPLLLPTHAHNPLTNRSTHQRGGSSPDFFQLFTSSSPNCHNGRSCFDSVTDRITKGGISVKPYKTGFRGRNCIFYCLQTPGASGQNKTACEKISQPVFALFLLPNTRQSVRPHQAPTPDSSRQPLTFGRAQGHRPTVLYSHLNFHLASCDAICCQQAFPLTLPNHSKKPWQQGHPKKPSDKAIAHSAQGRLATHIHLATHLCRPTHVVLLQKRFALCRAPLGV